MPTILTLFKNVLRKLEPEEVDANFEALAANVDKLGGYTASQTPGANQIPVVKADSSMVLPGHLIGGFGAVATTGVQDWNDITNARSGSGNTLLNDSDANGFGSAGYYYHPFSFEYSTKTGTGNMTQLAIPYRPMDGLVPQGSIYYRSRFSSVWGAWARLMATASDGTLVEGLKFPATQVPSSNPNTLDDYEEGTFAPTAIGLTTTGVGTYNKQVGRYTKIGNRVTISITLGWTAHTGTGLLRIDGLPFVANATAFNLTPLAVYYALLTVGTNKQLVAYVNNGTSYIYLVAADPSGGAPSTLVMDTAADYVILHGSYEV